MLKAIWLGVLIVVAMTWTASAQTASCDPHAAHDVHAIVATHTLPPYPPDAVKAGAQGKTVLRVKIDPMGAAYATRIDQSSGSAELDAAAAQHIKDHWRWNPTTCTNDRITRVSVAWKLQRSTRGSWTFVVIGIALLAVFIRQLRTGRVFTGQSTPLKVYQRDESPGVYWTLVCVTCGGGLLLLGRGIYLLI